MPAATLLSRAIADRVEEIGDDPFASAVDRRLIAVGGAEKGRTIHLGRPLRGSRIFPSEACRTNAPVIRDLVSFAAEFEDRSDWRFWNVGIPVRKAPVDKLQAEVVRFNKKINQHFTELRKAGLLQLILICIHVPYDERTQEFDLHAHFICRISDENVTEVQDRLRRAFSRTDRSESSDSPNGGLDPAPVRDVAACAGYALKGIFPHEDLVKWPPAAFEAAWELSLSGARLMRCGKNFSKWRTARKLAAAALAATDPEVIAKRERRARRKATRYSGPHQICGDVVRGIVPATIDGRRDLYLIVERHPTPMEHLDRCSPAHVATTQVAPTPARQTASDDGRTPSPVLFRTKHGRKPPAWWWRAWPYRMGPTNSRSIRARRRVLPGPIARRLARYGGKSVSAVENRRHSSRRAAGSMRP